MLESEKTLEVNLGFIASESFNPVVEVDKQFASHVWREERGFGRGGSVEGRLARRSESGSSGHLERVVIEQEVGWGMVFQAAS